MGCVYEVVTNSFPDKHLVSLVQESFGSEFLQCKVIGCQAKL